MLQALSIILLITLICIGAVIVRQLNKILRMLLKVRWSVHALSVEVCSPKQEPALPVHHVVIPKGLRMSDKGYKGGDPNYKPDKKPKDFTKNIIIPPHMRAGGGKK